MLLVLEDNVLIRFFNFGESLEYVSNEPRNSKKNRDVCIILEYERFGNALRKFRMVNRRIDIANEDQSILSYWRQNPRKPGVDFKLLTHEN